MLAREEGRGGKREMSIVVPLIFYAFIGCSSMFPPWRHNLGVSEQHFNQLGYLAMAYNLPLKRKIKWGRGEKSSWI